MLVARALARERGGASRLHSKYFQAVYSIVLRFVRDPALAEDLAQDAFACAFRHLEKLQNVKCLRGWLVRIAQRAFLKYKRDVAPDKNEVLISHPGSDAGGVLSGPESMLRAGALRKLVSALPEPHRTAIALRYFNGCTLAEVARLQGIDLSLAKYRVRQGLKLLRENTRQAGISESDL